MLTKLQFKGTPFFPVEFTALPKSTENISVIVQIIGYDCPYGGCKYLVIQLQWDQALGVGIHANAAETHFDHKINLIQ